MCRPKHVEWTCREINFTAHCRICWLFHRKELCQYVIRRSCPIDGFQKHLLSFILYQYGSSPKKTSSHTVAARTSVIVAKTERFSRNGNASHQVQDTHVMFIWKKKVINTHCTTLPNLGTGQYTHIFWHCTYWEELGQKWEGKGTLIHTTCENVPPTPPKKNNNTIYSVLYKVNFVPVTICKYGFWQWKGIQALYCLFSTQCSRPTTALSGNLSAPELSAQRDL